MEFQLPILQNKLSRRSCHATISSSFNPSFDQTLCTIVYMKKLQMYVVNKLSKQARLADLLIAVLYATLIPVKYGRVCLHYWLKTPAKFFRWSNDRFEPLVQCTTDFYFEKLPSGITLQAHLKPPSIDLTVSE
nr:AlNc14C36G3193 [Albugo laibachii Nc14]|eukprot:CCA17526.1 AlNc14C36G3193 [Albugo laibachii Nc14]